MERKRLYQILQTLSNSVSYGADGLYAAFFVNFHKGGWVPSALFVSYSKRFRLTFPR